MGTFRCLNTEEALLRDGGPEIGSSRECPNKWSNPACSAAAWPSAALLASCKCAGGRGGRG